MPILKNGIRYSIISILRNRFEYSAMPICHTEEWKSAVSILRNELQYTTIPNIRI